jgi:hypothetical protein
MQQTLIPIIALLGALAGVWLGSRLNASSSHREWMRDRTTQAYSIIFEALYDLQEWFSVNLHDEMLHRETDQATGEERHAAYRAAKDRLNRTLAREEWLLPDRVKPALQEMHNTLGARQESWFDHLDAGYGAVAKARKELIELAKSGPGKPLRLIPFR